MKPYSLGNNIINFVIFNNRDFSLSNKKTTNNYSPSKLDKLPTPLPPVQMMLSNCPRIACSPLTNSMETLWNSRNLNWRNLLMSIVRFCSVVFLTTLRLTVFWTKSCRNLTSLNMSILELLHTWNEDSRSSVVSLMMAANSSFKLCNREADKDNLLEALRTLSPFSRKSFARSASSWIFRFLTCTDIIAAIFCNRIAN